jgi:hypothetical protein
MCLVLCASGLKISVLCMLKSGPHCCIRLGSYEFHDNNHMFYEFTTPLHNNIYIYIYICCGALIHRFIVKNVNFAHMTNILIIVWFLCACVYLRWPAKLCNICETSPNHVML